MDSHLLRASILLEQSRYDLAEGEYRQALAADPDNALAHAQLSICLSEQEKYQEATEEAETAIGLEPDQPFAHYSLAHVLNQRNRLDEADSAIAEAIRLSPLDADYHALRSSIRFQGRRWADSLEAAERGLAADAEHVACQNLRAMSLVKLGRTEEAGATIDTALAREPEDALTHANQGWTLLEQGQHVRAMEHFREALRLEPEMDWARAGIVEALKSRHFIYRMMLKYFLWMAKLSEQAQWAFIIGAYVAYQVLRSIARNSPEAAPFIWPLLGLYIGFVFLSWTADPLFNLLLSLNRFGRLALSRTERVASYWIGLCLLSALLCVGAGLIWSDPEWFFMAIVFGLLIIPLAGTFNSAEGWPRQAMTVYTIALAAVGLGGATSSLLGVNAFGDPLFFLFLIGAVLSGWVANAMVMVRPKK